MNRRVWVVAACGVAVAAIVFARSAPVQSSSSNPLTLALAFLVALALVGGSIAYGLNLSERTQRDMKRNEHLTAIAVRLVFEDLARQIGGKVWVPQPDHRFAESVAPSPVLRGNHRGHGVRMWCTIWDPESSDPMGIGVAILCPDGLRWPRRGRLKRKTRIDGAPGSVDLLARLADPRRKPCLLRDLRLAPTQLSCVAMDVSFEKVEIEGTKVPKLADSGLLKELLDELTALADVLPFATGAEIEKPWRGG